MERPRCPDPQPDCQYKRPYSDNHHYYWPKSEYRGRMEKRFRECFVELMCRCEHDVIHQLLPPDKPDEEVMRNYLIEQGDENGRAAITHG